MLHLRIEHAHLKGTPNRISVEVRELVAQLVNDVAYQHRLRVDFRRRKVHPTIEALVWSYHLGKPRQMINLTASVDVTASFEEERRIFASLDLPDLQQLATESENLVERARELSRARISAVSIPRPPVIESEPTNTSRKST